MDETLQDDEDQMMADLSSGMMHLQILQDVYGAGLEIIEKYNLSTALLEST